MKMKNTQLPSTTDYEMFKTNPRLNRRVKTTSQQYRKIRDDLKNGTGEMWCAVIIDEDGTIADGQHRFVACKELNMPVEYIVRKGSAQAIYEINSYRSNWTIEDFVTKYINKKSYKLLRDLREETGFSYNTLHAAIKGKEIHAGSFKAGEFTVSKSEEENFRVSYEYLLEIVNVRQGRFKKQLGKSRLVPQLMKLVRHPNYKHDRIIRNISNQVEIPSVGNKNDAILLIDKLYNTGLPDKSRIDIR